MTPRDTEVFTGPQGILLKRIADHDIQLITLLEGAGCHLLENQIGIYLRGEENMSQH